MHQTCTGAQLLRKSLASLEVAAIRQTLLCRQEAAWDIMKASPGAKFHPIQCHANLNFTHLSIIREAGNASDVVHRSPAHVFLDRAYVCTMVQKHLQHVCGPVACCQVQGSRPVSCTGLNICASGEQDAASCCTVPTCKRSTASVNNSVNVAGAVCDVRLWFAQFYTSVKPFTLVPGLRARMQTGASVLIDCRLQPTNTSANGGLHPENGFEWLAM